MKRWSGYAAQTEAWRRGYDWANDFQDERIIPDILDDYGYGLHAPETNQFQEGVSFAQNEQETVP
jgi:hypothetical protein